MRYRAARTNMIVAAGERRVCPRRCRWVGAIDFNRPDGSGLPRRSTAKAGEPPLPLAHLLLIVQDSSRRRLLQL